MKTEQKAKAYDEALEQAQKELAACGSINCDAARQIFRLFPQLRESEDERIRNEIIAFIEQAIHSGGGISVPKEKEDRWLAYLEKQKDAFENGRQLGIMQEQARQELEWSDEKQKEQKPVEVDESTKRLNDNWMKQHFDDYKEQKPAEPAGKLSREEYLYQLLIDQLITYSDYEYLTEHKPTDDKAFEEWIDDWWKHNKVNNPDSYDKGDEIQFDEQGFKNFCRGIRNTYQQKPAEWSEDDEEMYINVASSLRGYAYGLENEEHKKHIKKGLDWLENRFKSLRPQPKKESAEEKIMNFFDAIGDCGFTQADILKLKSIWKECGLPSPQPHWKPSNEQINYLGAAVIEAQIRHNESTDGFPRYRVLKELYEQLLKL